MLFSGLVISTRTLPPIHINRIQKAKISMTSSPIRLRLDEFAFRQFDDPSYVGTKVSMDKIKFMDELKRRIQGLPLVDGYAPFCKHIFVKNFVPGVLVGAIPITASNEAQLRSTRHRHHSYTLTLSSTDYIARTDKELPVLTRFFPRASVQVPEATILDIILYSRVQVELESAALNGKPVPGSGEDWNWAVISVKGQLEEYELPMTPMTMMRNALGKEEGGSGVTLDREKYKQSVDYWRKNASIV